MDKKLEGVYCEILNEELQTALGCTEPIAIAYAAAYARALLGRMPERCRVLCSGNIIKNVKAVTVPQTGGQKGIEAAALAGLVGGDADLKLEVLTNLTDLHRSELARLMGTGLVQVDILKSEHTLHIIAELAAGEDNVSVEIIDSHTGLGRVVKNGELLHQRESGPASGEDGRYALLNLRSILSFAGEADIDPVKDALSRQLEYNLRISGEGLKGGWGASVGKTVLESGGNSPRTRAVASAAAGSDARMNGCVLPVVINSGSGNQGITVSVPVAVYAMDKGVSEDKLLRALCVSNLTAIWQKSMIGKLSAFCGAVSAATGAAAGIAWLDGADYDTVAQTVTNSVANVGGMVCDGAKSSCAGKITTALDSALLGYDLARHDLGFKSGEGIVKDSVDKTVQCVGQMAREGMRSTDEEILRLMIRNDAE